MAGRRVQYLHPVKMYIFISLVYFVLLFSRPENEIVKLNDDKKVANTELGDAKNQALTSEQKRNILLNLDKLKTVKDGKLDTLAFKSIAIRSLKNEKKDTIYVYDKFTVKKGKKGGLDTTYNYDGLSDFVIASANDSTYQQYLSKQEELPADKRDNFLERYWNKKVYAWKEKGGENTKKMIEEGVKHNAPKMMFLLLPLFALMLKISFYKNKKFYVEHLIFCIHFHCFMFLFLIVLMLLKTAIPHQWTRMDHYLDVIGFFGIMWYLYRSLRVVYHRSVLRTISKTTGLFFSYFVALCFSMLFLVLITAIVEV